MKIKREVTKTDILEKLTAIDIFQHYLGKEIDTKLFCSPLREDKNPSACLYYSKTNELRFKDFGNGQNLSCIAFVQEMFNLSFPDTIRKIASDFNIGDNFSAEIVKKKENNKALSKKPTKIIDFQPKPFTESDLAYWDSYGILKEETLKFYNIYSVRQLWVNKTKISIKKGELCFCYYFPKSSHCKILFPTREKKLKWIGNVNNFEDIQGYHQCDIKKSKPDILVLTSSLKEVMYLWEQGIYAMAINGENHNFYEDFIKHLRRHCNQIVSLYDWDEVGVEAGEKLLNLYNIEPLKKPGYLNCKDITDCIKEGQKLEVKKFINYIKSKAVL